MSGGQRIIAELAQRLWDRGHKVFAIASPLPNPSLRDQLRSLRAGHGWLPAPHQKPSHFDRTSVPRRLLDTPRPVTDADVPDADIVIATWWETAEWVAGLSPVKGAKVYFIQSYEVWQGMPRPRVEATYRLPLAKIVVSPTLAVLMATRFNDPEAMIFTQGVDTRLFYAPPRSKHTPPTVGMMYTSNPRKGCEISLHALALAADRIPEVRLVAYGTERPDRKMAWPTQTKFTLLPPQETLRDIYAQCDVWLSGSWSEGFHLPPMEAMACRCPVVSTRVGGPEDYIEPGVNGYLAPVGNSAALAEGLIRVLTQSEADWRAMSDAAYRTALRYPWDIAVENFESALQRLIQ